MLGLPAGRAFGDALGDELLDAVVLDLVDDRADVDGFVERRADAEGFHAGADLVVELLGDALLHEQARAGAADLALVEPDAVDEAFDGGVEIGVVEDDEGRFAAELEGELLGRVGGGLADDAADFGRAGEGDLVDVGMLDDGCAGLAVAVDDVEHACGQADFVGDLGEGERGERRVLGGLDDDGVAGGERGRDLPGEHQQREVPGDDLADDADGRVAGELLAVEAFVRSPSSCAQPAWW